ncbi:MAG TPA: hypothetical protein VMT00_11365 [Thermoanaerobaculia bacterium]|nr:hypothetical protein [Thermoanaerobaculia bacterium]
MNRRIFAPVALLVALSACRSEPPQPWLTDPTETETTATTAADTTSPVAAERWLDDFTLARGVNAEGRVPLGEGTGDFRAGDEIYLAMEVRNAPAGATVRVAWLGTDGSALGEDSRQLTPGELYTHFQAPGTASWTPGTYKAEVYANGECVAEEEFEIEK